MITLTREEAQQVLDLMTRYRTETPLGHQPHMISHKADEAIETLRARLGAPEPERPLKLGDMEQRAFDQECGFLSATAPPQRDFKFSTIDEAKQPAPAPAGKLQLTDDETRFAEAFTALIKAGYGKEAEIVLKSKKREWQGLTDEEVGMLTVFDGLHHVEVPLLAQFIRAIETKLKEKNT
jgi:hypothetical protein